MTGLLITFEGPDGAGKTTQITLLAEALRAGGYSIVLTREPGGTSIGDQIRQILLNPSQEEMAAETEVLLYAASRAEHVRKKIKPALEAGKIVLCDRFVDASMAYQGDGLGITKEAIRMINRFATGGLTPDKTILLDLSPLEGRQRLLNRENHGGLDRIEQKELSYHQRVRQGFLDLANQEERIELIDANQSTEVIHRHILSIIRRLLKARNISPLGTK